jgi:uncharacterized cupredoxin-like copper-binding protein
VGKAAVSGSVTIAALYRLGETQMVQSRRAAFFAAPAVLLALAIAGCGGSSSSSTGASGASGATGASGAGQTVKVSADPNGALKFTQTSLSAKSGSVTIDMNNPSSSGIEHGIAIEGNGVDQDGNIVQPGNTATVTANLKPGKYTFYCPFDSHKQQGMTGTLTVK